MLSDLCLAVLLMKHKHFIGCEARQKFMLDDGEDVHVDHWEDYLLQHVPRNNYLFDEKLHAQLKDGFDELFRSLEVFYPCEDGFDELFRSLEDNYPLNHQDCAERKTVLWNSTEMAMDGGAERIRDWADYIRGLGLAMDMCCDAEENLMHIPSLQEVACLGRDIGRLLARIIATCKGVGSWESEGYVPTNRALFVGTA